MPSRDDASRSDRGTLATAAAFGGSAVRVAAGLIDRAVNRAVDVVLDAEKAFRQGLDPNIEDAKILEEHDEAR